MATQKNGLLAASAVLLCATIYETPVQAAPVDFASANPNLVTNANSVSQTANGVTITAQAFTTEVQAVPGLSSARFQPGGEPGTSKFSARIRPTSTIRALGCSPSRCPESM